MFVEIFYVISLLSVTPHSPSFNLDFCEFGVYRGEPALTKTDFFNCIITSGEEYYTAIEGYVNMLCYAVVGSLHSFPTGSQSALPCTSAMSSRILTEIS
jgi:hypothetical protein